MTRRASRPRQLTIRGFDPTVEARIESLARREGLSLNQAVMKLLRRATGLDEAPASDRSVGVALDHLAGTWTAADERAFARATGALEAIDHDLWRHPPRRSRKRS